MDINLYRYIKAPDFKGMKREDLRKIAIQLLNGLS
jgi:hypothetical protein